MQVAYPSCITNVIPKGRR